MTDMKKQLNVKINNMLFDVVKNHDLSCQKYIEQLITNDISKTDKLDNFYASVQTALSESGYKVNAKIFVNDVLNNAFELMGKVK